MQIGDMKIPLENPSVDTYSCLQMGQYRGDRRNNQLLQKTFRSRLYITGIMHKRSALDSKVLIGPHRSATEERTGRDF